MKYLESYQFVFRSPKWLQNLLICTVAPMVPVVGPMVVLGYQFDIIQALHTHGDRDYPEFDFNRLMNYLLRGLWPFLVQLIVSLPLAMFFMVAYFVFIIGIVSSAAPGGDGSAVEGWLIFGGCAIAVYLVLAVAVSMVALPMILRAGLMMDFAAGFSWPYVRDFLQRMWQTELLVALFLVGTGMVVIMVGFMLFFVGIYPAAALIHFASCYLMFQLYQEYLRRGGQEFPLPVEKAPPKERTEDNTPGENRP
jgi:hypothetical protein